MKIIGLIGSLRKQSCNRRVFNAYKQLAAVHFDIEEAPIAEIPLYNQDVQEQGMPAAVTALAQQVAAAEGVVFFLPEYNYSIPGVLKNTIDWLSRCTPQPLYGKPCAIIGATPGKLGTARAQYHLRQVGVFLNIHWLNTPEVMIGQAYGLFDANGELQDSGTRDFLQTHAEAFTAFVGMYQGK